MFKRIIVAGVFAAAFYASGVIAKTAAEFDLVILNGRVMDPESGHDAIKNVGIRGGKIMTVTPKSLRGERTIDAKGLVVAPGFIDLHHHGQDSVGYDLSVQDGVTTVLELEMGAYPIARWYQKREGKAVVNFGASVSHPSIRAVVFGAADVEKLTGDVYEDAKLVSGWEWANNESTSTQREEMATRLRQGLMEGGLGFGFHLATTPGANIAEMLEFYRLSAQEKVPNFIHIRSVGQVSPMEAGREVIHAAQSTGASIHVVHINSSGLWETKGLLNILYDAQKNGLDITTEVYPYTGAGSSLDDPRTTKEGLATFRIGFGDLELVATGERLTEETFDYYKKHTPHGSLIAHIMDMENVDAAVAHPMVMIASDAGHFIDGRGHPRGAGTFARILGHYVRERQTVTLMNALRKVSLMPALRLENTVPQMKVRGRVQEGMVADITIFDAEKIIDEATYANPSRSSRGIAYVIVNGELVVKDSRLVGNVYPGQAIRRKFNGSLNSPQMNADTRK